MLSGCIVRGEDGTVAPRNKCAKTPKTPTERRVPNQPHRIVCGPAQYPHRGDAPHWVSLWHSSGICNTGLDAWMRRTAPHLVARRASRVLRRLPCLRRGGR
jgi:hypothetical protein